MSTYLKKLATLALLASIVGGVVLPLAPRTAYAQATATVEVPGPLLLGVQTTATADTATAENTTVQTHIMQFLNKLAWDAAKMVIQSMTKSVVNWINTGFQGSPAFETNLNMGLRSLGDAKAAELFQTLANSDAVQSPFLEKIVLGVGAAYYLSTSEERIQQRLRYTLNQVSQNDRAFLGGDFKQGGFDAWFSATLNSQNNPIGAEFILGQELAAQLENASFNRLQELSWGRGFLSWRGDCILLGKAQTGSSTDASLGQQDNCLQYDIKTPGSVIETQLGIVEGSPLRQLELADSINEIVAALMSQMVTQVLGSTGLLGTSQPSQGGGRSPLDQATDPSQYQSTAGNGLASQVDNAIKDTTTYQTGWQKIKDAAEAALQACGLSDSHSADISSTISAANTSLQQAGSALQALQAIKTAITGNPSAAALTAATDSFIALMSSGEVPSESEVQNATAQSTGTDSLLGQMNEAASECQ